MAEQEKRTFKWGDQEYLLDDLLKMHAALENNYYDFAKTRGQYDENALSGLRQAITNRINAVKSGQTFDSDGTSAEDRVDNTTIQTQKKGLFRKAKYVDQDNTEWAKYYLNKLVSNLKPYQKPASEDKGAWDIKKHGLEAYLTGQGLNARDIFEGMDKRNPDDPEAARSFAERHKELRNQLTNYRNWLATKNFDFTKNDSEWDDNHLATLDELINNLDWSNSTALAASLRKLGSGDAYTTAFTSDKWDLTKSSALTEADAKTAKKEKEQKEYQQYIKDTYGTFKALEDNNFGGTYFTSAGDGLFDMSDSEYENWLNTHTNDKDTYMKNLQESYYKNPFDTKVAGEYLPLAGRFGALKDVIIDGRSYKYDPRTIDRTKNRFVAFDPESGEIRHAFIGNIEAEKEALRRKWRVANGYEDEASLFFEEGGVISMQTGGGFNLAQSVNRDLEERNKVRAKKTGNTEKVQKARDRVVSNGDDSFVGEDPSIGQPNAGFTTAEKVRLGSIAADIGSIFLDPISGTAVGIGSSLANFGADIADDGWLWSDLGNLGINVGFDLLGAIPVFGDAVGTGAKITRKLVKFAPRIMAGLAAFQGVANFDGMMNSWSKFASGDKDQKLTVQDWRNIAQSIGLVTGGVRAAKNKAAQHQMKKQAKVDGVLSINVRNKNSGEIEQILVNGKTAEAIKNNKNNIQEIEKILSGVEGFQGKFGEGGNYEINTKGGKWLNPFGKDDIDGSWTWKGLRKEGTADLNHYYDFSRVRGYASGLGWTPPGGKYVDNVHKSMIEGLNPQRQVAENLQNKMSKTDIDAEYQKVLQDQGVNAQIEALNKEMALRQGYETIAKEKLTKAQEALGLNLDRVKNLASEADLQANKALYESELQKLPDDLTLRNAEQAIAHNESILSKNKARRAELSASRKEKIKQSLDGINLQIETRLKLISKYQRRINQLRKIQNPTPQQTKEIRTLSSRIQGLLRSISGLEAKKLQILDKITKLYTKEYARLAADNKTAKGSIATARPIADQRQSLLDYRAKLKGVETDLATYSDVASKNATLQQSVNRWLSYLNARNPQTAHTQAYTKLQTMLNNLKTSHALIGGRLLNWDMDDILKQYNLDPQKVFKQGGSIDTNKINKFLNYAKG